VIRFEKAALEDAQALTDVQVRTFDDDSRRFGGQASGGPPGYDSVDWQIWAMRRGIYFKILDDDQIIGGIILFDMRNRHFNLGRIYLDPAYQGRGIGTQAIEFIEDRYPHVKKWTLDTPGWATRNQHFYEKLGYVKVGEELMDGQDWPLWLYEKRSGPAPNRPT